MRGRVHMRRDGARTRAAVAAIIATLLVSGGGLACGDADPSESPAASPRRPNVLLVLVDPRRAARLGAYGNARGLTPFLDEFAASATLFSNAYATSSWTSPSIASLFTSRHPSQHRTTKPDARLVESEVTLAEALSPLGYATAGFVANLRLEGDLGFGQGFDRWRVFKQVPVVKGEVVKEHAMRWLEGQQERAPGQPIFLYVHLMEPHSPYQPPEDLRERFATPDSEDVNLADAHAKLKTPRFAELSDAEVALLESLYDAEVAAADRALRRLFRQLRRRGFLRDAVVVIVSDHGEEFREHDMLGHGNTLYESAVRVPFLVDAPGVAEGSVVEESVSLLDVAPTLLELVGGAPESSFEGRSLTPWLALDGASRAGSPVGVLTELLPVMPGEHDDRRHSGAYIRGREKLILGVDGTARYVDLQRDPGESRSFAASGSEAARVLEADLERLREQLATRRNAHIVRGTIDAETREKLEALGYAL